MGKFSQCWTELSAGDTIMVGYYSLTFLFFLKKKKGGGGGVGRGGNKSYFILFHHKMYCTEITFRIHRNGFITLFIIAQFQK